MYDEDEEQLGPLVSEAIQTIMDEHERKGIEDVTVICEQNAYRLVQSALLMFHCHAKVSWMRMATHWRVTWTLTWTRKRSPIRRYVSFRTATWENGTCGTWAQSPDRMQGCRMGGFASSWALIQWYILHLSPSCISLQEDA
jgi:hypothetical protein